MIPNMDIPDLIVCALSCTIEGKLSIGSTINSVQKMYSELYPDLPTLTKHDVLAIISQMVVVGCLRHNFATDGTLEVVIEPFDD
jgi:hypothetical protein